ncbi:MAG: glycosyltransferase [Erysipelotrichaceae bacterium]|nr:glycosyltransferase [Erysipelotrichaceae bacterium]
MKVLSVGIPCYNSMAYMDKAIESALVCKEDVEIIIVNDGSKDETDRIGKEYAFKYPESVKYVAQENGGHGEAVNTGLKNATGLYYKVLDSDDWFDADSLKKVVEKLKELAENKTELDMMIVNYVYEKPSENKTVPIKFTNVLPQNRVFGWDEVGNFQPQQNILMHSVIYRTQMLRDCGLKLPKHTFYVDNLFVYQPLPSVKTLYYMDVDFYRYFIGRTDQSVNEKVMISRIDQQLRVNKLMAECCDVTKLESKKLKKYMVHYITMISAVSTVLALKSGTDENIEKKYELWKYLKNDKPGLYKEIKRTLIGSLIEMDSVLGRKAILTVYALSQKIFGFN